MKPLNIFRPTSTNTSYQSLTKMNTLDHTNFLSPQEQKVLYTIDELETQFSKIPPIDRDEDLSRWRGNIKELKRTLFMISINRNLPELKLK